MYSIVVMFWSLLVFDISLIYRYKIFQKFIVVYPNLVSYTSI